MFVFQGSYEFTSNILRHPEPESWALWIPSTCCATTETVSGLVVPVNSIMCLKMCSKLTLRKCGSRSTETRRVVSNSVHVFLLCFYMPRDCQQLNWLVANRQNPLKCILIDAFKSKMHAPGTPSKVLNPPCIVSQMRGPSTTFCIKPPKSLTRPWIYKSII